jgi:hypothetical protein
VPKPATGPRAPIRISTNAIIGNKFYNRGEPLPFERVEDLPPNLRPLVLTTEVEPAGARGSFQLNTPYEVGDDNRLGRRWQRRMERAAAEMETENRREEWLEEQAASAELLTEVAQELEEEHKRRVGLQVAQAQADARRSDEATSVAAEAGVPRPL